MTKTQATKLATRINGGEFGGGIATVLRCDDDWCIEHKPAPRVDAEGNRWEQPTKFVYSTLELEEA